MLRNHSSILVILSVCTCVQLPQELVKVSVLHVLKHHDERVSIHTHAVELNDVLVLQVGKELRLPLEVLPG